MKKSKHFSISEFQAKFEGLEIAQNLKSITGGDIPPQTPHDSSSPTTGYVIVGPVHTITGWAYYHPTTGFIIVGPIVNIPLTLMHEGNQNPPMGGN